MKPIIRFFANSVGNAPAAVIGVTIVLTLGFGFLNTQLESSAGQEGFAPENEEILASERINELFGESATQSVMQVVVTSDGAGDVISADGLEAANAVVQELRSSDSSSYIGDSEQQPGIVTFMAPVQQAVATGSVDASVLSSDQGVKQVYEAALTQGGDQLGFVDQLVSDDGSTGLILVFIDTTDDVDAQVERETAVAEVIESVDVGDDLQIRPFSFSLLFAADSGFESEIARLFTTAFAIIIAILLFVYWLKPRGDNARVGRSARRTLADMGMTMLTIVLAIVWMNGIGALLQMVDLLGPFTEIAQIVPILLIGLGVDYAIHLTSRYREEVGGGESVDGGIRKAIGTVGVALTLATLTTCIGFLTNIVNPIPALRDFGILAAIGIAVSFVLMLTFVPAVREILDRRAQAGGRLPTEAMGTTGDRLLPKIMERTAVLAERAPIPTLVIMLFLGGLGYLGLTNLSTEFSFTDFLPADNPVVQTFDIIAEEFGGGFGETTQVLVEGDVAEPDVHNAMVVAASNMADTTDVITIETPFGEQAAVTSPASVVQQLLLPGPDGTPANPEFAQFAVQNGLDPQTGMMGAEADVAAIYASAREIAPGMSAVLTENGGAEPTAALIEISTQAGENRAIELQEAIEADLAPLADTGVDTVVTSQNIISGVIVESLSSSQVSSLVITLVVATLVLMISFWFENRRPFLGVITMVPVALVVLWTFGLMYVSGIPFGPVTATLTGLAVGIGVPYTIHMARRFEEDRSRFDDIEDAIRSTTRNTGGALAGSAFTTAAGFGILVTSTLTPFQQMGQVTAYAIVLSLAGAVLVLPSMLVLWEGWHRRRGHTEVEKPTVSVA